MGIEHAQERFTAWLKGQPSAWLTGLLLLTALVLIIVALKASPLEKAIVAAWTLFP